MGAGQDFAGEAVAVEAVDVPHRGRQVAEHPRQRAEGEEIERERVRFDLEGGGRVQLREDLPDQLDPVAADRDLDHPGPGAGGPHVMVLGQAGRGAGGEQEEVARVRDGDDRGIPD